MLENNEPVDDGSTSEDKIDESESEIEIDLSNATYELIAYTRTQPFVEQLFSRLAGEWHDITTFYSSLSDMPETLEHILTLIDGELVVTWLPMPGSPDFGIIFFFCSAPVWYSIAYYNKTILDEPI